eukprot:11615394-Ditylum_brightwellii.AAC.1
MTLVGGDGSAAAAMVATMAATMMVKHLFSPLLPIRQARLPPLYPLLNCFLCNFMGKEGG